MLEGVARERAADRGVRGVDLAEARPVAASALNQPSFAAV